MTEKQWCFFYHFFCVYYLAFFCEIELRYSPAGVTVVLVSVCVCVHTLKVRYLRSQTVLSLTHGPLSVESVVICSRCVLFLCQVYSNLVNEYPLQLAPCILLTCFSNKFLFSIPMQCSSFTLLFLGLFSKSSGSF